MTFFDLLILGFCGLALFYLGVQRSRHGSGTGTAGLDAILAGLLLMGLFSLADLVVMHGFPFLMPRAAAMDITAALRLDGRWWLSVVSVGLITLGVLSTERRLLGLSADLETQQSITKQELASLEQLTEDLRLRERMLAETQRRLRMGHWTFDLETHYFTCSEETRRLLGIDRSSSISVPDTFLDLLPEDGEPLRAAFAALRDDHQPQEISFRIRRPDGEERSLHVSAQREPDGDNPMLVRGTLQDVTEWADVRAALHESDEDFRRLFDLAQEGIWVIDADARTTLVNASMARMLGYREDEIIGRSLFSFMDEAAVPAARQKLKRQEEGIREQHDFEFLRKDRSRIHTVLEASPIHDPDACYAGAIAGIVDVTERVRAEQKLRYRLEFEELVAEISTRLIGVETSRIDTTVEESLRAVGEFLHADAGHVFLFSEDMEHYRLTHLWSAGSVPQRLDKRHWLPSAARPCALAKLRNRQTFLASSVRDMPSEAGLEKEAFERLGFKSVISSPMAYEGRVLGFTAFTFSREPHAWTEDEITLLTMVGRMFSNALNRKWGAERLKAALSEVQRLKEQLEEENVYLQEEIRLAHGFGELIGDSPVFKRCLQAVEHVAPTDVTILISGETGTGKELIARAIHDLSPRRERSLISVNCAALPPSLIENELFGHEKGAFTGAQTRQRGRFEMANDGTLFLDEIGDLPLELQGKLLRVLQEGRFERVGGTAPIDVDVRIIAATNRNLEEAVERGEFRADLYYRINTYPIHLPPLRERRADIPLLAKHFVRKHAPRLARGVKSISTRMLKDLSSRSWPGNVRELENAIERALITSTGPVLDSGGPEAMAAAAAASRPAHGSARLLREAERDHIVEALNRGNWVIEGREGAASRLGLAPSTLRSKMKKLGIGRPR